MVLDFLFFLGKMFLYGGIGNIALSEIELSQILNFLEEEHWIKLAWNSQILKLMTSLHKKDTPKNLAISGHIESAKNLHVRLKHICQCPSLTVVKRFIHGKNLAWSYGLDGACKAGRREIIDLMILKGADNWNSGLKYACNGGHRDIVEYMISLGANSWNDGLKYGCKGGHKDIANYMISLGACSCPISFIYACRSGQRDLLELLILNGEIDGQMSASTYWNNGLRHACKCGHKEIVEFMISKGANDWNGGLEYACTGGHKDLVELMLDQGANMLDRGLYAACKNKYSNIVEMLISQGVSKLKYRCVGAYEDMIDFVVNSGVNNLQFGLEQGCIDEIVKWDNIVRDIKNTENIGDTRSDMFAHQKGDVVGNSGNNDNHKNPSDSTNDNGENDSIEEKHTPCDVGNISNIENAVNSNNIKGKEEKTIESKIRSSRHQDGDENSGDGINDDVENKNILSTIKNDEKFKEQNQIPVNNVVGSDRISLKSIFDPNFYKLSFEEIMLRGDVTVQKIARNTIARRINKKCDKEIQAIREQPVEYLFFHIVPNIVPADFGEFISFTVDLTSNCRHFRNRSLWSLDIQVDEKSKPSIIHMFVLIYRTSSAKRDNIVKRIQAKFYDRFRHTLTFNKKNHTNGEIKFSACGKNSEETLRTFVNDIITDKTDILSEQDILSTHEWRRSNGLEKYYNSGIYV